MDANTVEEILFYTEDHMDKAITFTNSELAKVRTGKASPSMLDSVKIDYYGTLTPINQCANINTPEARLIVVQPWDKSMVSTIDAAIRSADLGLNPANDGTLIRVPIPDLTKERREQYIKQAKKIVEEGKIAVRNLRRDANDHIKKLEKASSISEDMAKNTMIDTQELTDAHIKKLDEILVKKESELREV
ncbi:MAG: ribosome recycling factor [Calditrichaeota bacterium]|nr:MAG: ribosome recycling factor [Calditrichota bacterium]